MEEGERDASTVPGGMKSRVRRVLLGAAALLLVAQLVPVPRTNPPVEAQPAWDQPRTAELFRRACADCHSHETRWPWYAWVAPASWLIAWDVREGRGEFNVSRRDPGEAHEAAEEAAEGEMPPWQYLPLHPEARLSAEERAALVAGLRATFGAGGDHEESDSD